MNLVIYEKTWRLKKCNMILIALMNFWVWFFFFFFFFSLCLVTTLLRHGWHPYYKVLRHPCRRRWPGPWGLRNDLLPRRVNRYPPVVHKNRKPRKDQVGVTQRVCNIVHFCWYTVNSLQNIYKRDPISTHWPLGNLNEISDKYRQFSNIRRTQSQNIIVSHLVLQLSLPNPLKPCVKLRMKM